jgi:hypothetical protein
MYISCMALENSPRSPVSLCFAVFSGLLPLGIGPSQGLYRHRTTSTQQEPRLSPLSGIRTRDPCDRVTRAQDSKGHCDLQYFRIICMEIVITYSDVKRILQITSRDTP